MRDRGSSDMSDPVEAKAPVKIRIATTSLAGCFGCHMSLLDIDERLLELDRDRRIRPLAAHRHQALRPLRHRADRRRRLQRRERACAARIARQPPRSWSRSAPARSTAACRRCATISTSATPRRRSTCDAGTARPRVPNDPELPLLLDKVYPINEVVRVDYFLPGCPPSGDAIWKYLTDLILGRMPRLEHQLLHYD